MTSLYDPGCFLELKAVRNLYLGVTWTALDVHSHYDSQLQSGSGDSFLISYL